MAEPDRITLADGAGGGATQRFIREQILRRFANPALNPLEDGAWLEVGSARLVMTTDSYIANPPVFPGGDVGRLAIAGTANDLIASGARPEFFSIALVLGEGTARELVHRILDSIAREVSGLGAIVATGDTKVLEQAPGLVMVAATGLGTPVKAGVDYALRHARAGDKIILTGTVGDHGLAVLSAREGLGFERRVVSDCAVLWDLLGPILSTGNGVHAMRDPTRGGLLGVALDIAEACGCDVVLDPQTIPITPEVTAGCEMLGLNPMELVNEGKMVLVADPRHAADVVAQLRQHPLGHAACIIGEVVPAADRPGRVVMKSPRGSEIVLRHEGLPIPRLC